jgi:hypothetical protein
MEDIRIESNRDARLGNQLSGRALGAIIFAGFGALWLVLAAAAREVLTVSVAVAIASVFVALFLGGMWIMQQSKRFPKMPDDPAIGRAFTRINMIEWIAAGIVAFTLSRLHLDAYIPAAISAIVGAHFFPLARLFRYPMHHVTGAAMVVWASVCVLAVPNEHLQSTSALGSGLILWISCVITITLAARVVMRAEAIPVQAGASR